MPPSLLAWIHSIKLERIAWEQPNLLILFNQTNLNCVSWTNSNYLELNLVIYQFLHCSEFDRIFHFNCPEAWYQWSVAEQGQWDDVLGNILVISDDDLTGRNHHVIIGRSNNTDKQHPVISIRPALPIAWFSIRLNHRRESCTKLKTKTFVTNSKMRQPQKQYLNH